PLCAQSTAALLLICVDLEVPSRSSRGTILLTAVAGLLLTGWYLMDVWGQVASLPEFAAGALAPFGGALALDGLSLAAAALLLGVALVAVLLSTTEPAQDMSGYISLILFAAL